MIVTLFVIVAGFLAATVADALAFPVYGFVALVAAAMFLGAMLALTLRRISL